MRCQPGDLCWVIDDDLGCKENIGAVVRIEDDQTPRPGEDFIRVGEWFVVSEHIALAVFDPRTFRKAYADPGSRVGVHDSYLKPFAGPSVDAAIATSTGKKQPQGVPA